MRKKKTSIILCAALTIACNLVSSCARENRFEPNYSSPEKAVETFFYANQHKKADIFIQCLSSDSRKLFGENYEQQVKTVQSDLSQSKLSSSAAVEIVKVEYLDESHAEVTFNQLSEQKIFIPNSKASLIKENKDWKISLPKEPSPTPEQIAHAEEAKRIIKTGVVLDEGRNVWVPADETSQQK